MIHPVLIRVLACVIAFASTQAFAVDRYVGAGATDAGGTHYSTIADAAAALQPGDHLVIAAGVYRDSIIFPKRDWSSTTPTIIEGRGRVVIDAADVVTGWSATGNNIFYRDWPNETAQVFVDGVALAQIGGTVFGGFPLDPSNSMKNILPSSRGIWPGRQNGDVTTLTDGSFFYDRAQKRLYVRSSGADLNSRVVEISVRAHGLLAQNVDFVQIKNLAFQHGNTSAAGRDGLVTLSGHHITLDHVAVDLADSVGIELDGDDNVISASSANYCGELGMKGRGNRMRLENSETDYNNTRGFNKWWEAGGVKFVGDGGLHDSVITGHVAIGNHGDGIWFDWGNPNNRIENSIAEYNSGFGIQYEASSGAEITGNRVIGNGQRGIYLPHSSHSAVRGNLVAGNGMEGIAFIDEGRRDPTGKLDLRSIGNTVTNNVLAWNGSALTVPGVTPDIIADDNIFVGQGVQLREWASWAHPFDSLPRWQQEVGLDQHSVQIVLAIDPAFANALRDKQRDPDLKWLAQLRATPGLSTAALATLDTLRVPVASSGEHAVLSANTGNKGQ